MAGSATVLGASGYSGGEVLRLLAAHPALAVAAVSGSSRAGAALGAVHPHLAAAPEAVLEEAAAVAAVPADVCFSCLPSGTLERLRETIAAPVIVDLSDEHRSDPRWTYGLTELARGAVRAASRIANPGCYPTAVLLALTPFARARCIAGPVVVDALSGPSGAGRAAEDRLLYANIEGSASAYGDTRHRHVPEMERYLAAFGGVETTISFTPHLAPMARGLLATIRAPLVESLDDRGALAILQRAYEDEPFVEVVDRWPATKAVAGSNRAQLTARVDERAGYLVCSCAIDNLGKGAAGQAVQNANLALGLEEGLGLATAGVWP